MNESNSKLKNMNAEITRDAITLNEEKLNLKVML